MTFLWFKVTHKSNNMGDRIVTDITLDNIDDFFSIGKKITNVKTLSRTSEREQPQVAQAQRTHDVIKQSYVPPYKM